MRPAERDELIHTIACDHDFLSSGLPHPARDRLENRKDELISKKLSSKRSATPKTPKSNADIMDFPTEASSSSPSPPPSSYASRAPPAGSSTFNGPGFAMSTPVAKGGGGRESSDRELGGSFYLSDGGDTSSREGEGYTPLISEQFSDFLTT